MQMTSNLQIFSNKCRTLREYVFLALREHPPVYTLPPVGHVVFLSICSGNERAVVVHDSDTRVEQAWHKAQTIALNYVKQHNLCVRWLKVDILVQAEPCDFSKLSSKIKNARYNEFFRYGLSLGPTFHTALLEAEMNGFKIWDYSNRTVSLPYLKSYLRKTGQQTINGFPDSFWIFQTAGWFLDEQDHPLTLISQGLAYGRRRIPVIDRNFVYSLIMNSTTYLLRQVRPNGSFQYGFYPRFDKEIPGYNYMRHASTIWSLICQYRITQCEDVVPFIENSIHFLIEESIVYSDAGTAYLADLDKSEIKIGGNGVAILTLTEYMDVFHSNRYRDLAVQLGNGILRLFDAQNGVFYHVLNMDFTPKESYRTVYYDGECTYALCRLYSITHDSKWLDAATTAVNRFVALDYTQYRDHWVAYAMNEITKYIPSEEYYTFALRNAQNNLLFLYKRGTTYHTFLEMLMVSFETYDRIIKSGIELPFLQEFDLPFFLKTIYTRANRMLNGYFFPEYAMYMKVPSKVLDTFMVRHDGYRIRIDDVQHNIGGYYLYYKNYDKLVSYGLLENMN